MRRGFRDASTVALISISTLQASCSGPLYVCTTTDGSAIAVRAESSGDYVLTVETAEATAVCSWRHAPGGQIGDCDAPGITAQWSYSGQEPLGTPNLEHVLLEGYPEGTHITVELDGEVVFDEVHDFKNGHRPGHRRR